MSIQGKNQIAIIGAGSAGTMGALRGVLNNNKVTLFEGTPKNRKKSRAFWVSKVENMPAHFAYKKGIVDPNKEVINFINESEFKNNLTIHKNIGITNIKHIDNAYYELTDSKDNKHYFEYVVLATGVMDVQPRIKDSIAPILPYANVQLADYCLRCDGHHVYNKETLIIGHTSSAAWVAIMLKERYNLDSIHLVANGEKTNFDDDVLKLMELYKIKVYESAISKINGEAKENKLESLELDDGTILSSQIIFISLGMIVYSELAKEINASLDERGFVVTNPKGESSVQNFYAAGDVRANLKKQIYTAWDSAVDSLDDINAKIRRNNRNELLNQ